MLGLRGLRSPSKLKSSSGFCLPSTNGEMVSALGAMETARGRIRKHVFRAADVESVAPRTCKFMLRLQVVLLGAKEREHTFRLRLRAPRVTQSKD
jgi:hypothetical protein